MALAANVTEQIKAAVSRRRQELIDLTIAFCSIPAENPPGSGLVESQQWIAETLAGFGVSFEIHDTSRTDTEHRAIIGSIGSRGPIMYLHGHYDVVPAFDSGQFDPEVREGSIYGRGTSDMKGGLVAMLIAALIHRELGGAGQVKLVYVPDEESGGADGSERLSELGLIGSELDAFADVRGAVVGEPSYPDIWYAARGAFTVRVSVKGKPAHVGLHYNGVNAFEQGNAVVAELIEYGQQVSQHQTALRIEPEAARSSIMLLGGVAGGGTNFNIVPDTFSFTIDRRPNPDEDYEAACADLIAALNDIGSRYELKVEVLQDVQPALTDPSHQLVADLVDAVADISERHASPTMCPGCLETRIYSRVGIPSVAYGPGPMTEMHEPTEHVPIDNLVEAAMVYCHLLGTQLGYED